MANWRDAILSQFVPQVSRLTLVADPDGLLTEERLALALRERGFDLIEFNDAVAFRYAYESNYRSRWDLTEHTDLVVILRLQDTELEGLPYDLLRAGRKLSFSLGDLFPNLSYPVIEQLDRSLLDTLYDAQGKSSPARLGDNATKDLILRQVFGIAAELITDQVELLRALLRLHYGQRPLPPTLARRLSQVLEAHGAFKSWPLEQIIADDEAFFAFLQERWPIFLHSLEDTQQIREDQFAPGLRYPGPQQLPFDHQDIRVYIDNLFLEGRLKPVQARDINADVSSWIRSGIARPGADDDAVRLARLFQRIEQVSPTADWRYSDWIAFALKWAELAAKVHCGQSPRDTARLRALGTTLNARFADWLTAHYASLINLPPTQPAMLHQVARRLARELEQGSQAGVALIVVDGLSLDQWVTLRQLLREQDDRLVMRESATFAWIPTLTSVSRQAIFAGKPPLYFPTSINTTNHEERLWKQFWEGQGLSRLDIAYQRGLGDGDACRVLDALVHPGKTKAVGLVVDKVDKIMHGMQLGAPGMHNQIKQWCQSGFIGALIGRLLDDGYDVWLTADHGNIECDGRGRPTEGVIAETRGERARIYPTPELRSQVATAFGFATQWQPIGLPQEYFPLLASGHDAFVNVGESIVAHGGIAIEEVLVPLVRLERRTV